MRDSSFIGNMKNTDNSEQKMSNKKIDLSVDIDRAIKLGNEFIKNHDYYNAVKQLKDAYSQKASRSQKKNIVDGLYDVANKVITDATAKHYLENKEIRTKNYTERKSYEKDARTIKLQLPVAKEALFTIIDIEGRTKKARKYLNELAEEYLKEHHIMIKKNKDFSDLGLLTGALDSYDKAHNINGMVKVSTMMLYHYGASSAMNGYLKSFNTMLRSGGAEVLDKKIENEFKPYRNSAFASLN